MSTKLQHISRQNLDVERYNSCVLSSYNHRLYAESWFLDAVTNGNWNCLVLGNYEAVMPLPFHRKFLWNYIQQPSYCQQLGVFSSNVLNENQMNAFLESFQKNTIRSYQFNAENSVYIKSFSKIKVRNNFVLSILNNEEELMKKIHKNRQYDIRKNVDYQIDSSIRIEDFIQLQKKNYDFKHNEKALRKLLLEAKKQHVLIQKSYIQNNSLLASIIVLKSNNRLIYLLSAMEKSTHKIPFVTKLIYEVMKENPTLLFDFEGSDIEGIANFYKSFGAENQSYVWCKNAF